MAVEIDHCRHHRLAGQVNARRSRWDLHLGSTADQGKRAVRHREYGILNGRTAITGDEARSFEDGRTLRGRPWFSLRRAGWRDDSRHDDQTSDVSDGFMTAFILPPSRAGWD